MDAKPTKIYYSPKGYWKGMAAIKKLANTAKVSEDVAKRWLTKQALWQVYLPGPHYIPRPKFDVASPNAVHHPANPSDKASDGCGIEYRLHELVVRHGEVYLGFKILVSEPFSESTPTS